MWACSVDLHINPFKKRLLFIYPWEIQWYFQSHLSNSLIPSPVFTKLLACSFIFCLHHGSSWTFHGFFDSQPEIDLRFVRASFHLASLTVIHNLDSLLTSVPFAFLILTTDWWSECPMTHGGICNCALNIGSSLWSSSTYIFADPPRPWGR